MEFLADQVQFINATAVPWVLRLVMLGLGLSLTLGDFKRVITFPKAAGIGLVAQLIGLPVTAFALAWLFDPVPTVAVGLVILAVCPSGVTSNAYTFAARGDVPLCVTLAAITSVITVFTIPFMISLALRTFMTAAEIELPVLGMLWDLAGLTLFPIAAGMLIRHKWSERAKQAEEPIRKMVLYLLYVVLAFGVITSWETIVAEFTTLGVMVLTMNLLTMGLGFGLGKLFKLPAPQIVTITYEVGVQNLALAFAITFNILQNPDLAVAALIYAAIMPVTALVFIRIARRMIESEAATQVAA
jgi:BASS family bile acid:Na+ symporter